MMPGTAVRPRRSITRVPGRGVGAAPSTVEKRPFRIDTVPAMVFLSSIVWILPFTRTSSSVVSPCAATGVETAPDRAAPIATPNSSRRESWVANRVIFASMAAFGRFLTTHVGSLPRPDDLIALMWAQEDGIPVDKAAMKERVSRAVDEAVARQTKAGVDIVNDGEWGKPSYATYIKDRLNGFGGTATTTYVFQDIEALPQTKARVAADPGRKHRKAPACNAPISVRDVEAPRRDAERLKSAVKAHGATGAFLTAASPGVTAYFFHNSHYRTDQDY